MSKRPFTRLDALWGKMLSDYRIDSLHMADFVRPYGRYIGMYPELKLALFAKAVKTIKANAEYSLSVDVPLPDYRRSFSKDFQRNILSPYAVAFIGMCQFNAKLARGNRYPDKLSYVMDTGNPYSGQVQLGHAFQVFVEKAFGQRFTGRLTFESDDGNTALQAADVISWSVQRRSANALTGEFAPLEELFKSRHTRDNVPISPHYFYSVKAEMLGKLKRLSDAAQVKGIPPELQKLLEAANGDGDVQ